MKEMILEHYKSRRNRACLVKIRDGCFVEKTFSSPKALQQELSVYRLLEKTDLPCARVLAVRENTLQLSFLPGINLVDCLQQQEETGIPSWDVWEKLARWLTEFHRCTGLVMTDVNLRNFLYDHETGTLYGLDFEECGPGSMADCAATVAAFLRTYEPESTPLKQEISRKLLSLFAEILEVEVEALILVSRHREAEIVQRRKSK